MPLFQYSFLSVVMIISLLNIHKSCKSMPSSVHPQYLVLWLPCSSPCPWLLSILKGVCRAPPHSFISSISFLQLTVPVPTLIKSFLNSGDFEVLCLHFSAWGLESHLECWASFPPCPVFRFLSVITNVLYHPPLHQPQGIN